MSTFTEVLAYSKSELWRLLCGLVTTTLNALIGPGQALLLSATLAVNQSHNLYNVAVLFQTLTNITSETRRNDALLFSLLFLALAAYKLVVWSLNVSAFPLLSNNLLSPVLLLRQYGRECDEEAASSRF